MYYRGNIAPYVVYITKKEVEHDLKAVYQVDVQLCLSGEVSKGRVCHQLGYPVWVTDPV